MKKIILITACLAFGYAYADNFGSTWHGRADDQRHTACWAPWPSINPPTAALIQQLKYLDSLITYENSLGCPSGTDMFLDDRLGHDGYLGIRTCKRLTRSGVCDESSVRINRNRIIQAAPGHGVTEHEALRFVWCHEIGHSLGLEHSYQDAGSNCMRTELHKDNVYRTHHIGEHIRNL